MLSWVQYAYGAMSADLGAGGYWTIGPIAGPAVIVEVRIVSYLGGFATFNLGMAVVTSPAPTEANFNAGVQLIGLPAESSVANTERTLFYGGDGAVPVVIPWPCWVPFSTGSRWVCMFASRNVGAANVRLAVAVRAERLWEDGKGPSGPSTVASPSTVRVLEALGARARRG